MLLFVTLIGAISGILYELILGTLSSYLLGNSVLQFSLTIGFFLSGMGIGAFLSRFLSEKYAQNFFYVEIFLAIVGISSTYLLKIGYVELFYFKYFFQFLYFFIVLLIGSLVGMEMPLIAQVLEKTREKRNNIISDLFTFDYIGGLLASLLFPLFLLPMFGLTKISLIVGSVNISAAILYLIFIYKNNEKYNFEIPKIFFKKAIGILICVFFLFVGAFAFSEKIENHYLRFFYKEPILERYNSSYQEIVLTKNGDDFRMFLNGNLQFLSLDEKIYHEALGIWPTNLFTNEEKNNGIEVLILGGGDGLLARTLLEKDFIKKITLVELDPKVIEIAKTQNDLVKLNKNSLNNEKVEIIIGDAFQFVVKSEDLKKFDLIIADFPDPSDTFTAKLYSKEFYISAKTLLKENGFFVTQSSNAFFAPEVIFSIEKTLGQVYKNSQSYHKYLPSFGDWGFVIASNKDFISEELCPKMGCTFFDESYTVNYDELQINTLSNPKLIEYHEKGMKKFNL